MLDTRRKAPVQPRAERTVETILDAAAQVLQQEGEARFNTNRVAEAAGYSIGTLYQYFPNKDAIVAALAERERAAVEATLARVIARADKDDLAGLVRTVVRSMIGAFGGRRRFRRFVILRLVRLNLHEAAQHKIDELGRSFIAAIVARDGVRPLSDTAAFVLARAVMMTIRAAVIEDKAILETQAFEDEIVELVLRFVAA